ncbi:centrosomal protein of 68 kDa isoform X2 [Esox lucius]|uniref:Centrosomal protein 68 n=1 Tax=Esox lucius TaxID=8010 RepID=A0A3P8YH53_ESOLU|nr:centrosomal protein of 68 kDa isoform X2 [Esox lucius]
MALGVDRAFTASVSPTESKGCSGRRWKTWTTACSLSGTGPRTPQHPEDEDRRSPRRSVTMAPTSRYMSDRRQYSVRKPLVATSEQQTSILKKSHQRDNPKKAQPWEGSSYTAHRRRDIDFQTRRPEQKSPDSRSLSQVISPRSASREDLSTSLELSDLRTWQSHEEPTFRSPCVDSGPGRRSLSSPAPDLHTFSAPLSPKWTSTLLSPPSPSCVPPLRPTRQSRTEVRVTSGDVYRPRGVGGETYLNVGSSVGFSKGRFNPVLHTMSPHQTNYWACAIPSSLPPSPDRHSSSWDPDKEYQALLDYTYPLRPGGVVGEWDSSDIGCGPVLQTDPGLQDSGIELDRVCSSTNLSGLDFRPARSGLVQNGTARERGALGIGQRSSDLHGLSHSKSSGCLSGSAFSSADPIGLYVESLEGSGGAGGLSQSLRRGGGDYRQLSVSSTSSATFIRTTSILPRPGCLGGRDQDEEFWPLPEQLEELHGLSRQVRMVTAQLSQPVTASWGSLDKGTEFMEKQEAEEKQEQEENEDEEEEEAPVCDTLQYFNKVHSGGSYQAGRRSGSGMVAEVAGSGVDRAILREVEAVVDQLSGLTLPGFQPGEQPEHRQSLLQHIQTFCGNLEELIQWLYTVVERVEVLAPPTVDIESVKSSLVNYKRFRREVNAHQPLTSAVLQTGELLLGCLTSTSPVLKETLSLIERQSRALETHSEHLFSSILSAMDSLTQPTEPSQGEETREASPRHGCGSGNSSVKASLQNNHMLKNDSGSVEQV